MIDGTKLNNMLSKLQLAEMNIIPAIEKIVRTTASYSEYEFTRILRRNEPIFYLQKTEFIRALEASRLLFEVKSELKFAGVISCQHNSNHNITLMNDSINLVQSEGKVEKSIASPMKEIIVNVCHKYVSPTNKVHLDQDKIKQLMQLHENIRNTINLLQDRNIKQKTDPLVKELEKIHNLTLTQQLDQEEEQIKDNVKTKTNTKKLYVSNKKPKKLILSSKNNNKYYDPIPSDNPNYENKIEKHDGYLTRDSLNSDDILNIQIGPAKNLNIDNIEHITSRIRFLENDQDSTSSSADTNFTEETPNEIVPESVYTEIPIGEDNDELQNISEAKEILRTCLDKLTYIRNRLNETAESSVQLNNKIKVLMEQNESFKDNQDLKDQEYTKQNIDMSTETGDINQVEDTYKLATCELNQLLVNLIKQINCVENIAIAKKDIGTRKNNIYTQNEGTIPRNPPNSRVNVLSETINSENQTNTNNREKVRSILNNTVLNYCSNCFNIKSVDSELICEGKCSTKLMPCDQDICLQNPHMKQQFNNIGLQTLISSTGPFHRSKWDFVQDPKDLPFKASLNSLPLSESDVFIT